MIKKADQILILPAKWREIDGMPSHRTYMSSLGLAVIATIEEHDDLQWLHVSCSRKDSLPTWEDLKDVKDIFIGKGKKAIQILPPEKEYVNFAPYVLHLWHCISKDLLPDFTQGMGMI